MIEGLLVRDSTSSLVLIIDFIALISEGSKTPTLNVALRKSSWNRKM